ncbi:MAG: hypothetical protein AB7N71_14380, partial [Phycisphaerae bacterium]
MNSDARSAGEIARIDRARLSARFVQKVPIHFARRHIIIGLDTENPNRVQIACADPRTVGVVENLSLTLGCETELILAEADAIQAAINQAYEQQRFDVEGMVATIDAPDAGADELVQLEGDLLDS